MGIVNTLKDIFSKKKTDATTSNTSLVYTAIEKPKWNVFKKKESNTGPRPVKGCPCGSKGLCQQKVTPRGVTIHYPLKRKLFGSVKPVRYKPPEKAYYATLVTTRPKFTLSAHSYIARRKT